MNEKMKYALAILKHTWAAHMWWFSELVHIGFQSLS